MEKRLPPASSEPSLSTVAPPCLLRLPVAHPYRALDRPFLCFPSQDPAEEADVFVLDSDAGTDGQPGRRRSAVKQIFPSTAEEDPTQAHDGPVSPARTVQITDREASASASSTAAVAAAAAGAAADEPKPTVSQDTGGAATTPATPPPKTAVTRASPSRGTARAQKARMVLCTIAAQSTIVAVLRLGAHAWAWLFCPFHGCGPAHAFLSPGDARTTPSSCTQQPPSSLAGL